MNWKFLVLKRTKIAFIIDRVWMKLKSDSVNKKTKNKKKTTFFDIIKKVFFWLFFFGFWIAAIWTIIFSSVMRIENIEIEGATEDKLGVSGIIESVINEKYFEFVPKNNLLTIPFARIENDILNRFIMVRSVLIERKFPKTINVKVERREKFVVWCSGDSCWFVDERAEAFHEIETDDVEKMDREIIIRDGSEKLIERGSKVIGIEIIDLCGKLATLAETSGDLEIKRNSFYIPSPVSGEVRVETRQGWEVYFSTERSILAQFKILGRILGNKIALEDVDELEYIDLRIKGKAVYRFRNYKEREEAREKIEAEEKNDEKNNNK